MNRQNLRLNIVEQRQDLVNGRGFEGPIAPPNADRGGARVRADKTFVVAHNRGRGVDLIIQYGPRIIQQY